MFRLLNFSEKIGEFSVKQNIDFEFISKNSSQPLFRSLLLISTIKSMFTRIFGIFRIILENFD